MTGIYGSLSEAANDASSYFDIVIDTSDLLALIRLGLLPFIPSLDGSEILLRVSDVRRFAGNVEYHAGLEGLFTDLTSLFQRAEGRMLSGTAAPRTKKDQSNGSIVFMQLSPSVGISFVVDQADAEHIQSFTASLRKEGVDSFNRSALCRVDVNPNVALWSLQELDHQLIRDLWRRSTCEEVSMSHTESLTIPKLYGSKSRMTPFLAATLRHYIPDAGIVLDLMSGTGIVSRAFSRFFEVYANDANDFAALLTRSQALAISTNSLADFIDRMPSFYDQNAAALMDLFGDGLSIEAGFLHGTVDSISLDRYRRYCEMFSYFSER